MSSIIALSSLVVAVLALVVALGLGRRLRQVRRSYSLRQRTAAAAPPAEGPALPRDVDLELADLRDAVVHSIRNVGVVRFDAFDDMGGRLSFAVAMLDEEGSGVVFSSINGRNETRIYAKPVVQGTSKINLSEEEEEAIRRALGGVRA